jgi:hypothetical protein
MVKDQVSKYLHMQNISKCWNLIVEAQGDPFRRKPAAEFNRKLPSSSAMQLYR